MQHAISLLQSKLIQSRANLDPDHFDAELNERIFDYEVALAKLSEPAPVQAQESPVPEPEPEAAVDPEPTTEATAG